MSTGSIGSVNNASPSQQSSSAQSDWQNVLSSVSGTLGLSSPALKQQLQSGESLSSIAQTQGVSQQTLIGSIQNALTQNGSTASRPQLQQAATNIANRTPGAGHHHHHGGGGGGGVASLLDTDDTSSTDSTDSTDPAGPSAATPTSDVSFADQLSAATSSSSLLAALTDPSSSQDGTATLANLASDSDLWQGINSVA
ncbi:MAG TPA: hypothetical protein VHV28_10560 [Solirubrobacteraceae bacterium]|jgi:hypothetical protein|nr:hypothetical protein [Solirubrobacteraceae bacterium]